MVETFQLPGEPVRRRWLAPMPVAYRREGVVAVSETRWVDGPVSAVTCTEPERRTLTTWDRLVVDTSGTDVAQLRAWAQVRRAAGFTPLYVLAYAGADLVAGAQILQRRLPVLGRIGYLPFGPVIAPHAARAHIRGALGRALAYVGRHRLRMLFVQPPEGTDDMSSDLLSRGFRPSAAGIAPTGSIRVDLSVPEAELQRGLSRQLRNWARNKKWEANGVVVRVGDENDVPVLADLLAHSAAYQGFEPFSEHYLRTLYRELAAQGCVRLLLGEIGDGPVAGQLYTACGGTLKLRIMGYRRTETAQRLRVPGALMWEGMRWGKAHGYRWFDLGGLRPESLRILLDGGDRNALHGADEYKVRSGGTPYRYPPPVELISSAALRASYDLSRRWRGGKRLLNFGRRLIRGGRSRPAGMQR
ncbi:lipid II:glycine glycyltransferase FemX [Gandjariella thermophila]|uniref:BioF2-like acetyltransferase domain-containing protein n=1 Tax=Gandjariella thermophila TaxID=1931992 RepID=A0A4D4JBK5_9PSEU|nr:GNAT family N-acetyltransferase [Gandjariella thermophila]GDY32048.1 hypothetical protein GTS_36810 [Gandjariella thermophila]